MWHNKQVGFTLIELIMVVVLLGTLSAIALPKFFDKNTFSERAFIDDTLNAVRYAQKLAIATGCNVQVSISSTSYTLTRQGTSSSTSCPGGSTYTLAVPHPSSGASSYSGRESGITFKNSTVFYFYPKGDGSADVTIEFNGSVKTISVIAETGFVYDSTP